MMQLRTQSFFPTQLFTVFFLGLLLDNFSDELWSNICTFLCNENRFFHPEKLLYCSSTRKNSWCIWKNLQSNNASCNNVAQTLEFISMLQSTNSGILSATLYLFLLITWNIFQYTIKSKKN